MIQFTTSIPAILEQETDSFEQRDPDTYLASRIGFCARQLYLSKLGLKTSTNQNGKFRIANLIQNYLQEQIQTRHSGLETGVSCTIDEPPLQFVGRCSLLDPVNGIAYILKVRNGWYQFSPPVERHIDQLQIYLKGLSVSKGKVVYISKNNLGDIREYPAQDSQQTVIEFDQNRYDRLVEKAITIREAIWKDGIATAVDEIPFEGCGCYFCQSEEINLEDPSPVESPTQPVTQHDTEQPDPDLASRSTDDESENLNPNPPMLPENGAKQQNGETPVLASEQYHIPNDLRNEHLWVVWDGEHKRALAPWQEGSMYPCEWAESKDCNPRRSFETAQMVAELSVEQIHESWPFPERTDLPEEVLPAVLLPHQPSETPVTFVDFDDVRDPQTGEVTNEVAQLIDALNGYTEVSRTGTGLHVYVKGGLPEDMGMFCGQLSHGGNIEIYDHGRFTGGTWQHVAGTPKHSIPEAKETISSIIAQYTPAPEAAL